MQFSDKAKEQIRSIIMANGYFAIYRKAGQSDPVLIMENGVDNQYYHYFSSISDLESISGFVVIPYDYEKGKNIVVINPQHVIRGYDAINDFLSSVDIAVPKGNTVELKEPLNYDRERYNSIFDIFRNEIDKGRFKKLVLTRNSKKELPEGFDYLEAFERACLLYPDQMVCMWHSPATSCYICATPEIMLSGKGNEYCTVSLAGTMLDDNVMSWSDKNKEEQEIVSYYIRNTLSNCNIDFRESEPQSVRAGNVRHIKTQFEFYINDSDRLRLLSALYPTPAISGFPKEAKKFILENEGYDRDYYSAVIGPIDIEEETDLYVNLRTAKIHNGSFYPYAGGGILSSSNVEDEWNETEMKMKTICDIINGF